MIMAPGTPVGDALTVFSVLGQTQTICITFVQGWTSVAAAPTMGIGGFNRFNPHNAEVFLNKP